MESSQKDEENSSELTTKDQENWGARNNDQKFITWESSLEPSFEWDRAYSDTPHISVSSAYEDPREVQGGSGERSREPWMPEMLYNRMGAELYDETQKELWTTINHTRRDQSKSLCADHTRVQIQAKIGRWLSPQPSNRERIFRITGIAGSGKSTLSATVVDNLRKKHTPVAAQFFISRNILDTSEAALGIFSSCHSRHP
ncbi:hypothetical protein B0H14DRAFT_2625849 [Mycena olivaceomarginata]|nr:hypothetical protein B0H14DRAFT_2625849 [Mycena olivaceomarginata]